MQYNLNQDVMMWLDSVRGSMSRQQYITMLLRQQMQNTESTSSAHSTKEIYDTESNHSNTTRVIR